MHFTHSACIIALTVKTTTTLRLGPVSVRLLRYGDEFPCPKKGHPPFLHERSEPAVVLYRGDEILRVVPAGEIPTANPAVFRGNMGRKPWALSLEQVARLILWVNEPRPPARVKRSTSLHKPKAAQITVPAGKSGGQLRRRAHTIPAAGRGLVDDCDYIHKLSPEERAWKDQFDRETILNRWYDDQTEALYPRGSEGRRKLQFAYNRRADDIYNTKEWHPSDLGDASRPDRPDAESKGIAPIDVLPSPSPTENDLIDAIDRSREE